MPTCPHCGAIYDEPTDRDERTALGLWPDADAGGKAKGDGKGRRPVRRTALPKDWRPTPEMEKYCRQQGKDPADFLEKFRSHYLAKGTVWKDWGLVWQKACREWSGPIIPKYRAPAAPVGLVTPAQAPRPAFVPETREVRLAAMIISYRKVGKYLKANDLETELAELENRPPVHVPAPDSIVPSKSRAATDIEWEQI